MEATVFSTPKCSWCDKVARMLTDVEIESLLDDAFNETGAETIKEMGKVMGWLKPKLQGRADMKSVSASIKQRIAGIV